jgi:2-polyprenyl-3-methyl-5-hydroxy-6-metoxy-1,4-benzoquinol methylase
MTNLDLYAVSEHLLGIKEATEDLHDIYSFELDKYNIKTLLDVGCGGGAFMHRMISSGIKCKGVDLSSVMVDKCIANGLDAKCGDIYDVDGKYDAIVSIFDVLNFMEEKELIKFLDEIANKLNDDGIFIADINTLYGFRDVAEGAVSYDNDDEFLSIDARFANHKLHTKFTLFKKSEDKKYIKYQDIIVQYFHKIKVFQNLSSLKLISKRTFSLYDVKDKTLLIFKKR